MIVPKNNIDMPQLFKIQKLNKITIMKYFFIISAIIVSNFVVAQNTPNPSHFEHTVTSNLGLSNLTGSIIQNLQTKKSTISTLKESTNKIDLLINLGFKDDYVVKDFLLENQFKIKLKINILLPNNNQIQKDLEITDRKPNQLAVVNLLPFLSELDNSTNGNINIEVAQIITEPTQLSVGFAKNLIDNKLEVKATVIRDYGVDVRSLPNDLLTSDIQLKLPVVVNNRVSFSWDSPNNYPNYEIQILHLLNESNEAIYIANDYKILTSIDWNKALKVETQSHQKSIDLQMMEGRGFYIWRVRPIGNYYNGGIANSENYGLWTNSISGNNLEINATNYGITSTNPVSTSNKSIFFIEDKYKEFNWIYSRVFTEGDINERGVRTSEGMVFADNLLRTRQTQSYDSQKDIKIVNQTLTDYMGRPALQTIPVPIEGNLEGYKYGLVKTKDASNQDVLYTTEHFDADDKIENPNTISDDGSNYYKYYNGSDPDGVSSTEGYSFSKTVFATDGTGRALKTSGIGKRHALGTIQDGKGRITQVIFETPSEEELLRIFGEEAPLTASVIKSVTIDPNGVASVAYTSKEGKTIATALINKNPDNLSNSTTSSPFDVNNGTNINSFNGQYFESTKRIFLTEDKDVTLEYINSTPAGNCSSCQYKLQFYLIDINNQIGYVTDKDGFTSSNTIMPFDVQGNNSDFTMNSGWQWVDLNNTGSSTSILPISGANNKFSLPKGEYILAKRVYSNNNNVTGDLEAGQDVIAEIMEVVTNEILKTKNASTFNTANTFLVDLSNIFVQTISRSEIETQVKNKIGIPTLGDIPDGFSIIYVPSNSNEPGTLTINNGQAGDCAFCGSSSFGIPKPEICYVCDATLTKDQFSGIKEIRENPINANQLGIGQTAWNLIKSRVVTGTDQNPSFIDILHQNKVYKNYSNKQLFYDKFAPGFTEESMIYMLTNMLTSRYYTGQKALYNGNYYAAKEDENGSLQFIKNLDGDIASSPSEYVLPENLDNLPFNYDCKELFNCWYLAVDAIKQIDGMDNVNVMDSYNDNAETSSEDESNDDSSYEDAEDKSVLDIIAGWVKDKKLRDFNDSDEGKVTGTGVEAMVSLPNMLLECSGYQFDKILDEKDISNLPSDYQDLKTDGTSYNLYDNIIFSTNLMEASNYFGQIYFPVLSAFKTENNVEVLKIEEMNCPSCSANNEDENKSKQLYYPYILKPHWMFKYFNYNSSSKFNGNNNSIPDENRILINQLLIEITYCYNDLYANCRSNGYPSCIGNSCNYFHENWSTGQMFNFYQQIRGARKCPASCDEDEPFNNKPNPVTVLNRSELDAIVNEEFNKANNTCDYRFNEFKNEIVTSLINSCYEIVECKDLNAPVNYISEASVDVMANKAVAQCKLQIEEIKTKYNNATSPYISGVSSQETQYPWCIIESCNYLDASYNCQQSQQLTYQLFPECDQIILDQVNSWNFSVNILPADINNDGQRNNLDCPGYTPKEWKNNTNTEQPVCGTKHVNNSGSVVSGSTSIQH